MPYSSSPDHTLQFPITVNNGEPRVLDTDLAERLGMKVPRNIRKNLILPNRTELEGHRDLGETNPNTGKAGRPAKVFYLNEQQALLIAMFSRTEKAASVRKLIIDVFMAWRRGHMDLTEQGKTALPDFGDPVAAARAWADVYEGKQKAELKLEMRRTTVSITVAIILAL